MGYTHGSNVDEAIRGIIREQLDIKPDQDIKPDDDISEDLGADSLDKVELVMALEEEFQIEILDEDAEKVKTVQDAVTTVSKKLVT